MATLLEQQRLRLDIGLEADDVVNLPDADADAIYVEAGESYTDAASLKAATRVIALERLLAQAILHTDYTQNDTSEKSSQIFEHYKTFLTLWQDKLATAVADATLAARSVARFGRSTRSPSRIKEFPGY